MALRECWFLLLSAYIVTSKPKRISVADGDFHITYSLIYTTQNSLSVIFLDLLHTNSINLYYTSIIAQYKLFALRISINFL